MPGISVIVPTYNRPDDLGKCLASMIGQQRRPDEVLVVDDGALEEVPGREALEQAGIRVLYLKKDTPGLPASRNRGIDRVSGEYVLFLDDDVVLEPAYIAEIVAPFEAPGNEDVAGVGGWILNPPPMTWSRRLMGYFEMLFLMNGPREGKVLPSGFCVDFGSTDFPPSETVEVDFLPGGVAAWRRSIFDEFRFNEKYWAMGDRGEDKDFSYRVARAGHRLLCNPRATLYHYESPHGRYDPHRKGREQVLSRLRFFNDLLDENAFQRLCFHYALWGYLLRRALIAAGKPTRRNRLWLAGALGAYRDILAGHNPER